MHIPWTNTYILERGGSKEYKSTELLRQQVQLHPEDAEAHSDLGHRLRSENVFLVQIHKKRRLEWTEASVREWYERQAEVIQEFREAFASFTMIQICFRSRTRHISAPIPITISLEVC